LDQPLVQNVASRKQVESAKDKERRQGMRASNDLRAILATVEGRRFMWRLLGRCKTFSSIYEASARIHYNAGQQDIGHNLLIEIDEADPEAFFKMRNEAQQEGV
jgi:hypothetical protein